MNVSVKYYNLLQHKWLRMQMSAFKRAAGLGIAKSLVNVRNVNVFIDGIWFVNLSAKLLKIIFLTFGNSDQ